MLKKVLWQAEAIEMERDQLKNAMAGVEERLQRQKIDYDQQMVLTLNSCFSLP